jgi:hypothetical protein
MATARMPPPWCRQPLALNIVIVVNYIDALAYPRIHLRDPAVGNLDLRETVVWIGRDYPRHEVIPDNIRLAGVETFDVMVFRGGLRWWRRDLSGFLLDRHLLVLLSDLATSPLQRRSHAPRSLAMRGARRKQTQACSGSLD